MMPGAGDPDVPSVDIDLYDPAVVDDPWPMLAEIRRTGDLLWNRQGYWMTASDRVCREGLSQFATLGHEGFIQGFCGAEAFITINDCPRHNELRDVWVAAFGHNGVERLVPEVRSIIARMMGPVIETLRAGEPCDLFAALCRTLPAHVIAHMMGVSGDMTATVIQWADDMARATMGGFPIDFDNDPYWRASENAKQELA